MAPISSSGSLTLHLLTRLYYKNTAQLSTKINAKKALAVG
jgi:hypothetical protein